MDPARGGVRGARRRQRPGRARPVAAGARAGLPGGGAPVAPRTPHRATGWSTPCARRDFVPKTRVICPPTISGADEMIRAADLAMVYGGQDVVDKYADDPTVIVNGPGRAKILITADRDWRDYLDIIVDSIANLGGMACVNTTAVLYEGDPAPLAHGDRRAVGDDRAAAERRRAGHPAHPAHRARQRLWRTTWPARPRARRRAAGRRSGGRRTGRRLCRAASGGASAGRSPNPASSTSSCRSRASGWRRGRAPPASSRCGIPWSSPRSPATTS